MRTYYYDPRPVGYSAVAAVDENWAIGREGQLLCHISADLKRFKSLTMGHPVILGRKTLATFPGGRPLPGRRNLILSRNPDLAVEGGEVLPSLEAVLDCAPGDTVVIGGESVYRALLPYCSTVYVTKILSAFPDADAFFPDLDSDPQWTVLDRSPVQEEAGVSFQYVTYGRVP